ncbi:MAG: A24 family peptidase [Dehalococcoidia bacterium]|jgi:leader peptidase (prepilin peptidase)/N-methyltransferase|nr:A24 family peptidase [Dehalococcoidia bacterium]MDW8008036.1 A24 family peptidase [Chloroflexota bacterium]
MKEALCALLGLTLGTAFALGWPLVYGPDDEEAGEEDGERGLPRGQLPWRGLILPLTAAALGMAAARALDEASAALLATLFGTLFLALAVTDLERRLLPNRLVYPGLVLALALSWAWPDRGVVQALAGAFFGLVVLGVAYVAMRGGLGAGDVKLAALIGAVVGFPGVALALSLGAIAGGVAAAFLLLSRLARRGQYMPYGPFLVAGALTALLLGERLWGHGL